MRTKEVINRIFVVGSPRSGTSLLQSLLGSHYDICAFPETHIYYNLFNKKVYNLLGITPARAYIDFNTFWNELNPSIKQVPKHQIFTQKKFLTKSLRALDRKSLDLSKFSWSEKTPLHLHCIEQLSNFNNDLKFIHIIRKGKDVIKSSFTLSKKYNTTSWGNNRNLDYWISRWVQDLNISKKFMNNLNHYFVFYEELIANPQLIMDEIFTFLALPHIDIKNQNHKQSATNTGFTNELWHPNLNRNIGDKIETANILSDVELQKIEENIPHNLYNDLRINT